MAWDWKTWKKLILVQRAKQQQCELLEKEEKKKTTTKSIKKEWNMSKI